ncbi:hypothetical protein ACHHYP_13644 [Achlya hypogyna]|uniref:Uncharacterized protein n=1 Tax=Achlya hypogyna TaxID=1202772 RepID=A0A1V9ZFT5_ACHHY|nr:hypothetical protein ACHHYP_13644 [Achlya hypogyna]
MAQNYIAQKQLHASSKEAAAARRQAADDSASDDDDTQPDDELPTQPRGKQLRFPVPAASTEGSGSDEDSDDYASLSSSDSSDSEDETPGGAEDEKEPQYIIQGARARKRVRPPNDYSKNMAAYVRGCLLLIRECTKTELNVTDHDSFRVALAANNVQRIRIVEPMRIVEPDAATDVKLNKDKSEKKVKKESKPKPKKDVPSSPKKPAVATPPPAAKPVAEAPKPKPAEKPVEAKPKKEVAFEAKGDKEQRKEEEPKTAPTAKRPAPEAVAPPAKKARPASAGHFIITSTAEVADTDRILQEARDLSQEGVRLKHLGDSKTNKVATGVEYLRASIQFLRQALLFSDLKAIAKLTSNQAKAGKWGKDTTTTLSQTATLIESTIGLFNKAGHRRLAALSYKLAAIVHLTSYRLQHNMLYGHYSQLNIPGRSPDGLGAPSLTPDQEGMRRLILREMGLVMRGFDFWRYYEATGIPVLPEVPDPVTVDFAVLYTALERELADAT